MKFTRVMARVPRLRGAPWPSCLVMDSPLRTVLGGLLAEVEKLEHLAARRSLGRPALVARLLKLSAATMHRALVTEPLNC